MKPGRVIVNADDLGVSRGATSGVVEAHHRGIVTSASMAVTTPDFEHAVSAVRECPDLGVGLHFTLTSGRPASDPRDVPLLVDKTGFFRWRFTTLLLATMTRAHAALGEQIALELDAQMQRLSSAGIRADHIDGERHVHLIPEIFPLIAAAAVRHGVPFVRVGRDAGYRFLDPRHLPGVMARGGMVKSALLALLSRMARGRLGSARSPDFVASYVHTGRTDQIIESVLSKPPIAAITEIMVHPGIPEESRAVAIGNAELERYLASTDRRRELDACVAARRGSTESLTNYRALAAESAL